MDFELNDELKMFQRAVRDFCEKELKPHATEADETGQLALHAASLGSKGTQTQK